MPKKDPDPPKSDPEEPKSESEPSPPPQDEPEKPKKGTPEWERWIGQRISEGRRKAKAEADDIPTADLTPKPAPNEQKEPRTKKGDDGDIAGIVVGLIIGVAVIALLFYMLRHKGAKKAPIDTQAKPAPEPAPEPKPILEPGGPPVRSFLDDQEEGQAFRSVLDLR